MQLIYTCQNITFTFCYRMKKNKDAAVLVHPESPREVIKLADVVGSTSQLISACKSLPNKKMIVATDNRIFYKMKKAAPNKVLIEAPTGGSGATCISLSLIHI